MLTATQRVHKSTTDIILALKTKICKHKIGDIQAPGQMIFN